MTYRWWEHFDERYADELRRLDAAGITHRVDEDARKRGILRLHLKTTFNGDPLKLCATFPDLYPFFRFEIQAFEWDLSLHQNPFDKHLCLFQFSTWNWRPTSDYLADFVKEIVPNVCETAHAEDTPPLTREEPQAEPATVYFSRYALGSALVDERWQLDVREGSGNLTLGSMTGNAGLPAAVLEVTKNDGTTLAVASEPIRKLFSKSTSSGRWIHLEEPPFDVVQRSRSHRHVAADLFDFARRNDRGLSSAMLGRSPDPQVYAIIFPEQRSQRGTFTGFGWIFLCRPNRAAAITPAPKKSRKGVPRFGKKRKRR